MNPLAIFSTGWLSRTSGPTTHKPSTIELFALPDATHIYTTIGAIIILSALLWVRKGETHRGGGVTLTVQLVRHTLAVILCLES
jgi:hypothetical protein